MKMRIFFRSFFRTLFCLAVPLFLFAAVCEVYTQTAGTLGQEVAALYWENGALVVFGHPISFSFLSWLAWPGRIYRFFAVGFPMLGIESALAAARLLFFWI